MEESTNEVVNGITQVTTDVATNVATNVTKWYDTALSWISKLGLNLVSALIVFLIGWFAIKGILTPGAGAL